MFIGEVEWRGEFLAGIGLGSWDWEHENLDTSLTSGSEIDVLVIFGELQRTRQLPWWSIQTPVRTEIEDGDLSQ